MSDFNTVRNVPNAPDAYDYWTNSWIFGLPQPGQLSSAECGAMPFRKGDGLCSPYCLRSEDKAFLYSVMNHARSTPSNTLWPNRYSYLPLPYIGYSSLRKDAINDCYNFLSAAQSHKCFGTGIRLNNSGATLTDYTETTTISNLLTGLMQVESWPVPPDDSNALSLAQVSAIFNDTKKLRCTISDAGYRVTGSTRNYYDWYAPYTGSGSPTLDVSNISNVYLVNYHAPYTQKISAEAMVLVVVTGEWSQSGHDLTVNAVLAVGNKFMMTNSQSEPSKLQANVNITGQQIANVFGALTGWNMRPSANQNYAAKCLLRNRSRYLVVWPKWLVDY